MEAHFLSIFVMLLISALAHIRPKRLLAHVESDFGATEGRLVTVDLLALVLLHRADHVVESFCPGHRPCSMLVVTRSCTCPASLIVRLLDVTLINMLHGYAISILTCLSIESVLEPLVGAVDLTTRPIDPLGENMTISCLVQGRQAIIFSIRCYAL